MKSHSVRPLPSSYPQALWEQEKQRALLQSLLARDTDSMAGLSVLYNPCPSRGSASSAHHHALTPSQLAAPIAAVPSLFLVTDLGCILSADETVLTAVLRHVTRDVPPAPADIAALLLRMANAEPVTDVASQALL